MMTITASTASSSRRENAPRTSSCVGSATGSRVTAYPSRAAAVAMASSVRTLPVVARLKVMTPMVRNSPRLRARAALLGR